MLGLEIGVITWFVRRVSGEVCSHLIVLKNTHFLIISVLDH